MRHCGMDGAGKTPYFFLGGHCGMDVDLGKLWYDVTMRHCGMDVTYETLWYGCGL